MVVAISARVEVRRVVVVRQAFVAHGPMPHRVVVHAELALHACAAHRTQHGGRHRTPHGEQHGKQQEEPDAKGFHCGQVGTSRGARKPSSASAS